MFVNIKDNFSSKEGNKTVSVLRPSQDDDGRVFPRKAAEKLTLCE